MVKVMFIDSFVQGHYTVRSASGKQTFVFEDSDQFGPSAFNERKDEVSPIPDKHWFWKFYQTWRDAGRPTDGEQTYRYGVIKRAVWPATPGATASTTSASGNEQVAAEVEGEGSREAINPSAQGADQ